MALGVVGVGASPGSAALPIGAVAGALGSGAGWPNAVSAALTSTSARARDKNQGRIRLECGALGPSTTLRD